MLIWFFVSGDSDICDAALFVEFNVQDQGFWSARGDAGFSVGGDELIRSVEVLSGMDVNSEHDGS